MTRPIRSPGKVSRVMRQVSKKFGVKLHYNQEDLEVLSDPYLIETNFNRCTAGGRDEISIGIYTDEELRLISFFHELGHTQSNYKYDPRDVYWDMELHAWKVGLTIAYKMWERFSHHALTWADKQLSTYVGYEEEQCLNYVPYNPNRVFSRISVRKFWRQLSWRSPSCLPWKPQKPQKPHGSGSTGSYP